MSRKKILHIIDSLTLGGAESQLISTIQGLSYDYDQILVYLHPPDALLNSIPDIKVYCLKHKNHFNIFRSAWELKKIIQSNSVDIVHSHLYWSTIISRLATRKLQVSFYFSVHSLLGEDAFRVNRLSLFLERWTYSSNQNAVFVSQAAQQDYIKWISLNGPSTVHYNFVEDSFHNVAYYPKRELTEINLVTVGILKRAKNIDFLLDVMKLLHEQPIQLDICGDGPQRSAIEARIKNEQIKNVVLKGSVDKILEILPHYDAFISASLFEGFGIAMVEAMATGLPCLISDIPVFREVTRGQALFFDPLDPCDLEKTITEFKDQASNLETISGKMREIGKQYSRDNHLKALHQLYSGNQNTTPSNYF